MRWKLFWVGLGLLLVGFGFSLAGSNMASNQQVVADTLAQLFERALKAWFTSIDKALNGETNAEKLQGIGSVLSYLGAALLLLWFIINIPRWLFGRGD